ncbi:MAG: hypothetical protein ACK4TA_05720 [Saprospiraceae bacterium]
MIFNYLHGRNSDVKTDIFKTENILERDTKLYATMSDYFSPNSEYKKI